MSDCTMNVDTSILDANNFYVSINLFLSNKPNEIINLKPLVYNIREVSFPSTDSGSVQATYRGMETYRPGERVVFGDFELTFLSDENLKAYRAIRAWMLGNNKLKWGADLFARVSVFFLDSNNRPNQVANLDWAFPASLSGTTLGVMETEVKPVEFTVTFGYSFMSIGDDDDPDGDTLLGMSGDLKCDI